MVEACIGVEVEACIGVEVEACKGVESLLGPRAPSTNN